MENTKENKSKFFALHFGQKVFRHVAWGDLRECIEVDGAIVNYPSYGYLQLAPLSSITDQDGIELAKIGLPERVYDYLWSSQTGKHIARSIQAGRQTNTYYPFFRMGDAFDFLRSKGYAVDWLCLSVDEQVKYGWVKLKDKEESK